MTAVSAARTKRRSPVAAKASATLQRWPSRNHFAEIAALSPDEPHPIDRLLERESHLRRVARRIGRLLAKVQAQVEPADLLAFEAEQTLLDSARVELAFNLGFENGLVLGRADALRQVARRSRDVKEKALVAELRAALARTPASAGRTAAVLMELAWALVLPAGPPTPGARGEPAPERHLR